MIVWLPTPPIVKPLISLSGKKAYPAYSILTYFSEPLLSAGLVPPYKPSPSLLLTPPSISPTPLTPLYDELTGAFPKITKPAQSPRCGVDASEENTMGLIAVPSALILALRVIMRPPLRFNSPTILVPGSMVSTAPLVTYTNPRNL